MKLAAREETYKLEIQRMRKDIEEQDENMMRLRSMLDEQQISIDNLSKVNDRRAKVELDAYNRKVSGV